MTGRRLVAEPIRAWKHAGIVWHVDGDEAPRFRPRSAGGTYGVDEVAECRPINGVTPLLYVSFRAPEGHTAPHPDCTCGFYATKEPDCRLRAGQVALEVALSGTVIVHERGYRAQRQQVVGVRLPATCRCGNSPAGLAHPWIAPVCDGCKGHDLIQPADLAGALGVGVAYADRWSVVREGEYTLTFTVNTAAWQQVITNTARTVGVAVQDIVDAWNAIPNSGYARVSDGNPPTVIDAPDESNAYPLERTPRHVLARQQGLQRVSRSQAPKAIEPRSNRL